MKNVSAFVVLSAFIISVVLTGCADLDNALRSLKVDQQKADGKRSTTFLVKIPLKELK